MQNNWMQIEQNAVADQDAYRYSRDQQRRFYDGERAKERCAEPIETEVEFDEDADGMERSRR